MPSQQPSSTSQSRACPVDPRIWRACAGSSVQIPSPNSRVYYFPQGHVEQTCPSVTVPLAKPVIPCTVSHVEFLGDPLTDQVFAKVLLKPVDSFDSSSSGKFFYQQQQHNENAIFPFAKVLTPSDANNGGGFSVPRFCADSIFPPLNYQADPPVQTLSITDIQGTVWEFRHIYRGTPRRHLLTTGWSKFVNRKKLIAGDSVVFMRETRGKMYVGIRRSMRHGNNGEVARWREHIGMKPEAVVEAVERAAMGFPFEVMYYPRAGWADFIVRVEMVDVAMRVFWTAGMRVKMAVETEDLSRLTWVQGTVMAISVPDNGQWCGSPWRMLEVTWDEPEILHCSKRVSPWQIEFVSPTRPLHATIPPAKRSKFPQNSVSVTDGEEEIFFPLTGLTNSAMEHTNPSLVNYNTFPVGMQGARQNPFSAFSLSNFISENTPQVCIDSMPKLQRVSTELNIGSSQSDNLSPDSHGSVHSYGTELLGNQGCNLTKVGIGSFQLFGKIIHMNQPVGSGLDDVACLEDDGSKGSNVTEGLDKQMNLPLTYTELLNRSLTLERLSS
ncbi:auxin response factor 17-like isoform X1 [Mangifera indica]|uniref:auxin response factor 17-like isoform X1 n=1 Tax=Mangifera indica TaxID=29780 RepID=UPI001CFAA1FA|nr:auxin response factor 17-like isoform X1 [Mangifera indica]